MEIEGFKEKEEVIEGKGAPVSRKRKVFSKKVFLILVVIPIVAVSVIGAGVTGYLFMFADDEDYRMPPGMQAKPKRIQNPTQAKEHQKVVPKQPLVRSPKKITVDRNPFRDFYERRYLAKMEKNIKKKILQEIEARRLKVENEILSRLKSKIKRKPAIDFKVHAIICTDECIAITSEGVIKNGDFWKGYRLRVTRFGVSLDG